MTLDTWFHKVTVKCIGKYFTKCCHRCPTFTSQPFYQGFPFPVTIYFTFIGSHQVFLLPGEVHTESSWWSGEGVKPCGAATRKVRVCPKLFGFILWAPWISPLNTLVSQQTAVEIFLCGLWWCTEPPRYQDFHHFKCCSQTITQDNGIILLEISSANGISLHGRP